jgi:hypothetical protein
VALVVALAAVYATCYSMIKIGLALAPPLRFAGLRARLGGAAPLGFGAITGKPLVPRRRRWLGVLAIAATGSLLSFGAMFLSPGRTGAGIASVLGNSGPLLVIILAALFLREPVIPTKATPGALVPAPDSVGPDPALGIPADQPDMLIAEVKEGRAELNAGATDPAVLQAAVIRFGCCDPVSAPKIAEQLRRRGRTTLPNGHPVRLAAFGSTAGDGAGGRYLRLTHGHILRFLRDHLRQHWQSVRIGEAKDPAFGFLMLLEKAERCSR